METLAFTAQELSLYDIINIHDTPMLLMGTKIKHSADHNRLQINPAYNPVRFIVNDTMMYGVKLEMNPRFFTAHPHRLRTITSTPMNIDRDNQLVVYKERLKMYGLSCDNYYGELDDNIFPLDVENLSKLTINSNMINPNNLFIVDDNIDIPWYCQYANPKLYIITNER